MAQSLMRSPTAGRPVVSLGLDEVSFASPKAQAGQYGIASPRYAKTNSLMQLSGVLSSFAPAAAQLGSMLREGREEQAAEFVDLLTPEQAQAVLTGDLTPIENELNTLSEKLDERQRKKFINFVENPANYIRASKLLGVKVGTSFEADFIENQAQYIQDNPDLSAEEIVAKVKADMIEQRGLSGYSLMGFNAYTANFEQRAVQSLASRQASIKEEQYFNDTVDGIGKSLELRNTEAMRQIFQSMTNAMVPQEQANVLIAVGQVLDTTDLQYFIGVLSNEDTGLTMGKNAPVSDGVLNSLSELLLQKQARERQLDQIAFSDFSAGATRNVQKLNNNETLDPISLSLGRGLSFEIAPPPEPTDEVGYYEYLTSQIDDNELLSEGLKIQLSNIVNQSKQEARDAIYSFRTSSGMDSAIYSLMNKLDQRDEAGNNVFGFTNEEIDNKTFEYTRRYEDIVDEIYRNPTLSPVQKQRQAKEAVISLTRQLDQDIAQVQAPELLSRRNERVLDSLRLGADALPYFSQLFYPDLKVSDGFSIPVSPSDEQISFLEKGIDRIRTGTLSILNKPRTQDEVGLTENEVFFNRRKEAEKFVYQQTQALLEKNQEEERVKAVEAGNEQLVNHWQSFVETNTKRTFGEWGSRRVRSDESPSGYKVASEYEYLEDRVKRGLTVGYILDSEERVTTSRQAQQYLDITFPKRLVVENAPALTVEEIRSRKVNGVVPIRTDNIDITAFPVLSHDMVLNPNRYENEIREYAAALEIEPTDEAIKAFIIAQGLYLEKTYGLTFKKKFE